MYVCCGLVGVEEDEDCGEDPGAAVLVSSRPDARSAGTESDTHLAPAQRAR